MTKITARKDRRWFNLRHYWRKHNGEVLDVRLHDHGKEIQWDFLGNAFITVDEEEGRECEPSEELLIRPLEDPRVLTIYIDDIYIAKDKPSSLRPGEIRDMLGITGKEAYWIRDYLFDVHLNKEQNRGIKIPNVAHQKAKKYLEMNIIKKVQSHIFLLEQVDKTNNNCTVRRNLRASKVKDRLDKIADRMNKKETDPNIRYIVWTIEEV